MLGINGGDDLIMSLITIIWRDSIQFLTRSGPDIDLMIPLGLVCCLEPLSSVHLIVGDGERCEKCLLYSESIEKFN